MLIVPAHSTDPEATDATFACLLEDLKYVRACVRAFHEIHGRNKKVLALHFESSATDFFCHDNTTSEAFIEALDEHRYGTVIELHLTQKWLQDNVGHVPVKDGRLVVERHPTGDPLVQWRAYTDEGIELWTGGVTITQINNPVPVEIWKKTTGGK